MSESQMQITVSHRIPLDLARWIAKRADELGISKSEVLRRALAAAKASNAPTNEEAAA